MASDDDMCPYASDDEPEAGDEDEMRDDEDDASDPGDDHDDAFATRDVSLRAHSQEAQVLSELEIMGRQSAAVAEAMGILSISEDHAALLLRAYRWNVSHATDEWFSDEEAVRSRLGLVDSPAPAGGGSSSATCDPVFCGICLEEHPLVGTAAADCGHRYCSACLGSYIDTAIQEGPGCLSLRCPSPECRAALGDRMVMRLAGPGQAGKFRRFLLHSFVDGSANVKWCPAPGCSYAVLHESWRAGVPLAQGLVSAGVECRCGHVFCWNCLQEPHRPVDCALVSKWVTKNSAESENCNWILANSKPCPKCKRPIEKNHGCMHMTCSPPCKHEFCWLCLADWRTHGEATGGFYSCNRYEAAKRKGEMAEEEMRKDRAKQSLERYLHFYERWATNEASRRKAVESLRDVEQGQADCLRELLSLPAAQLSFLAEAWRQIVECRRVLKWTYAFGFYLEEQQDRERPSSSSSDPGSHDDHLQLRRNLFEHLQCQAEAALDWLHKCAEKDVEKFLPPKFPGSLDADLPFRTPDPDEFVQFRSNLTRLTAVTRGFFNNLVGALEGNLAEVGAGPSATGSLHGGECPAGQAKGREKGGRKGQKRRRMVPGSVEGDRADDTSGIATIDSGDEDLESGEEGDTGETMGGGSANGAMGGAGPGEDEEEEYWMCPQCTYANPRSVRDVCDMCKLPRAPRS